MKMDRRSFLSKSVAGTLGLGAMAAGPGLAVAQSESSKTKSKTHELDGKAAIVTGARNNIGRAIAVELARMGSDVVVHHHTPDTRDQAEETARLVGNHGRKAVITVGDLGKQENVIKMFDAAESAFGRLDIFVHNAGALTKGPLVELSDKEYDRMQRINVDATFWGYREAARRIRENGRIIGISTSITASPPAQYGVYGSGKAFMNLLSSTLAKELGARGITVNTVCPGPIDTPFFHSQETPETVAYISKLAPMGRLGEVREVIPAVAMLVSSEGQWLNGETIYVNGGYAQA